jgi:hypothetical protein
MRNRKAHTLAVNLRGPVLQFLHSDNLQSHCAVGDKGKDIWKLSNSSKNLF